MVVGVVIGLVGGLYNLVRESLQAVREAQAEDEAREGGAPKNRRRRRLSAWDVHGAPYARFLGLALAIVVGPAAPSGWLPTRRLAGDDGAACDDGRLRDQLRVGGAGGVAADRGRRADTPDARMQRAFLAMVVRLAVVVVLGLAAALSGEFARMPLLFWLATSYVVLLPLEVKLAIAE